MKSNNLRFQNFQFKTFSTLSSNIQLNLKFPYSRQLNRIHFFPYSRQFMILSKAHYHEHKLIPTWNKGNRNTRKKNNHTIDILFSYHQQIQHQIKHTVLIIFSHNLQGHITFKDQACTNLERRRWRRQQR